eukprot:NODE_595_length_5602_cov_0.719062.p4 type:complete len:171 gc:universal NODE_595_length_5602_cov_0.719062:2899-3411(+)
MNFSQLKTKILNPNASSKSFKLFTSIGLRIIYIITMLFGVVWFLFSISNLYKSIFTQNDPNIHVMDVICYALLALSGLFQFISGIYGNVSTKSRSRRRLKPCLYISIILEIVYFPLLCLGYAYTAIPFVFTLFIIAITKLYFNWLNKRLFRSENNAQRQSTWDDTATVVN